MKIDGVVLIGPPGSGKSTIGRELAVQLNMKYISTGDIARELATTDETTKNNLARGGMANETLMRQTLLGKLREVIDDGGEFILDGFPRNIGQFNWLLDNGFSRLAYVHINIDKTTCMDRLLARGREDDNHSIIGNRMDYYERETRKVLKRVGMYTIIRSANVDGHHLGRFLRGVI